MPDALEKRRQVPFAAPQVEEPIVLPAAGEAPKRPPCQPAQRPQGVPGRQACGLSPAARAIKPFALAPGFFVKFVWRLYIFVL
ncbi:MAG: hypothetical protein PVH29_05885 [Candidatus Zixiibacteriota bacterium]